MTVYQLQRLCSYKLNAGITKKMETGESGFDLEGLMQAVIIHMADATADIETGYTTAELLSIASLSFCT
jgi:hypothetical protein